MELRLHKVVLLLALVFSSLGGLTQSNPATAEGTAEDRTRIIEFLGGTISWYHQLAVEQKLANQPSDVTFVQQNRSIADQVVQLAFAYARTQAQLQDKQSTLSSSQSSGTTSQYQRLNQALQQIEKQIQDTQSELQANREKLAGAGPARRRASQSQIDELQSELGLLNVRRDALQSMAEFVSTSNGGGKQGFRAQIEALARSVPAALSGVQGNNPNQVTPEPSPSGNTVLTPKAQPTGIWALSMDLLHLSGTVHTLNDQLSATEDLKKTAEALRAPLINTLRSLIHQGDTLFSAADTATPAVLGQQKQQLDALTAQFKQTSASLLPLNKVGVLLGIYETTLTNWRESVRDEEHDELRQLLLRLGVLAVLIGVVFGLGELWRRATFRYIHDGRRRHQFLLLRRVVIWITLVLIILLTFATQLGSAVTFAGLLTAGVAVALQNVIVSIVGYFFLIGKYGLRVGDRVQIAGVTGEVVEIGLVRIHLMELGGPGESQPSGRVVAFSNSIVFQPTAGVFKQIPGTNFVWHELKLTLSAEADYHTAQERITQAVDAALGNYRERLDTQRRSLERSLTSISIPDLRPRVRLHYTASGLEATVRFPVEIEKAAEMDDRMMHELIAATGREPKLKLVGAEMPGVTAGG